MLHSGARGWDWTRVFALENGDRTGLGLSFVILLQVPQESKQINCTVPCVPVRLHRADWNRNDQLSAWSLELFWLFIVVKFLPALLFTVTWLKMNPRWPKSAFLSKQCKSQELPVIFPADLQADDDFVIIGLVGWLFFLGINWFHWECSNMMSISQTGCRIPEPARINTEAGDAVRYAVISDGSPVPSGVPVKSPGPRLPGPARSRNPVPRPGVSPLIVSPSGGWHRCAANPTLPPPLVPRGRWVPGRWEIGPAWRPPGTAARWRLRAPSGSGRSGCGRRRRWGTRRRFSGWWSWGSAPTPRTKSTAGKAPPARSPPRERSPPAPGRAPSPPGAPRERSPRWDSGRASGFPAQTLPWVRSFAWNAS